MVLGVQIFKHIRIRLDYAQILGHLKQGIFHLEQMENLLF